MFQIITIVLVDKNPFQKVVIDICGVLRSRDTANLAAPPTTPPGHPRCTRDGYARSHATFDDVTSFCVSRIFPLLETPSTVYPGAEF